MIGGLDVFSTIRSFVPEHVLLFTLIEHLDSSGRCDQVLRVRPMHRETEWRNSIQDDFRSIFSHRAFSSWCIRLFRTSSLPTGASEKFTSTPVQSSPQSVARDLGKLAHVWQLTGSKSCRLVSKKHDCITNRNNRC